MNLVAYNEWLNGRIRYAINRSQLDTFFRWNWCGFMYIYILLSAVKIALKWQFSCDFCKDFGLSKGKETGNIALACQTNCLARLLEVVPSKRFHAGNSTVSSCCSGRIAGACSKSTWTSLEWRRQISSIFMEHTIDIDTNASHRWNYTRTRRRNKINKGNKSACHIELLALDEGLDFVIIGRYNIGSKLNYRLVRPSSDFDSSFRFLRR